MSVYVIGKHMCLWTHTHTHIKINTHLELRCSDHALVCRLRDGEGECASLLLPGGAEVCSVGE
jgi:hypothetical protein